jgi:hypothetical protein
MSMVRFFKRGHCRRDERRLDQSSDRGEELKGLVG